MVIIVELDPSICYNTIDNFLDCRKEGVVRKVAKASWLLVALG
jgi:hypothetical protein